MAFEALPRIIFLHVCSELFVHVSQSPLFSSLLVHSCVPEEVPISTVIPIVTHFYVHL